MSRPPAASRSLSGPSWSGSCNTPRRNGPFCGPGLVAALGDEAFADGAPHAWAAFVTEPERVTSTVQEITGTPARTLRAWAGDHADDFR